jgi:hypothetical protein
LEPICSVKEPKVSPPGKCEIGIILFYYVLKHVVFAPSFFIHCNLEENQSSK